MAPTRASSQRPGLWKPLAPHALRAGFEATPGGGAFYGKTYSFDALSLTARSSFDSFDASSARSMLFASSASNDCECTNTLAHRGSGHAVVGTARASLLLPLLKLDMCQLPPQT